MADDWGTARCLRDIHDGQVVFAWPVTVEGGDHEHVRVAQLAGSVGMVPEGYPDDLQRVLEQVASRDWRLVELVWQWTNCLHVLQPDQWWGTRLMWSADTSEFLCWYVDFLVPVVRSGDNLDTRDLQLDIVVMPDGSWVWKDEDHYQYSIDVGLISQQERDAVEDSRNEVIESIEARRFPFDTSLLDWRAPTTIPTLPSTWSLPVGP